ncbi:MAG: DNA primase [Xanthomonadaceae bacterium]|nr:DNA primase [Xanthomonadaceae bacterium]
MTSYYFPPEFVAELRERVDVVEVVGDYVSLVKSGANFKGLCPFHGEKTPSFMVHRGKGIYHCFGCGVGGDAISFIRKIENLTYPEALLRLAIRCGMDVSLYEQRGQEAGDAAERQSLKKQLGVVLDRAHKFFQLQLQRNLGSMVGKYLDERGISTTVAEQFELGYAPDGWDNLVKAIKKPADLDIAVQAGLIVKKDNGKIYDRFRDRLLFPIRDVTGKVVGFGGRTLSGAEPKYLNSSESPLFQKRRLLYDLYHAKRAIGEQNEVFMVEGYMDALSLYVRGIDNVVATLGTALSEEHLKLVKRYGDRVAVFFDNDKAGLAAAFRSLPIFLRAGVFPALVLLPSGVKDPDQLARQFPVQELQEKLQDQVDLFDYYLAEQEKKARGRSYTERLTVLQDIVSLVAVVPESGMAGMALRTVADRLHLAEEVVLEVFGRVRHKGRSRKQDESQDPPAANVQTLIVDPEDMALGILSRYPRLFQTFDLEQACFEQQISPIFVEQLRLSGDSTDDLTGVLASHPQRNELLTLYSRLVLMNLPEEERDAEQALADCLKKLKIRGFRRQEQEIDSMIMDCSDTAAMADLLRRKMDIVNQYKK